MSGIAGIYNFDGRPVDPALLQRMTDAIAHRGPDGIRYWIDGAVGLGHCMLHTTPESVYEKQPLTDESGNVCLTMDGRVDNREELISALKAKDARLRDDTDAEIVLKAYECWGTGCPARIIGDFSFVVWDKRQRQLFCVRDAVGNKPFVYFWDGLKFLWASELHQLFEDPTVPHEPNEGMIGEYLAVNITHTEETLYKGILRLPPAHYLIIKSGRITKHRYWDIDLGKQLRYRSDDEYAEHFTAVFREAVRSCLRSHRPVGAHLSGGLDSSSVVCMAQDIYRRGLAVDRGFETFSMVYPGLPCDETDYIRPVVERWNLSANYLRLQDSSADWLQQQSTFYKDICDYPNGTQTDPIRSLAQAKGFRVMLTGDGGDERLGGSLYYLSDFVRQGRVLALFGELRKQGIGAFSRLGLSTLFHYALVPLFPLSARAVVGALKRAMGPSESMTWIDAEFRRRIGLKKRLKQDGTLGQPVRSSKVWLRKLFNHGGQVHGAEVEDRSSSRFGIEQRHPFRDRRMVEFSFALPENQRLRADQKFVLRQAMQGLLPDLVRRRQDKAEFSETLFRAVTTARVGQAPYRSRFEDLGWIDRNRVRTMQREMEQLHDAQDEGYILRVWPLWIVCALELWAEVALLGRSSLRPSHQTDADLTTA